MILITMAKGCAVMQESLLCKCRLLNVEKYSLSNDFLIADIKQSRNVTKFGKTKVKGGLVP